jgi:hypothetical protein
MRRKLWQHLSVVLYATLGSYFIALRKVGGVRMVLLLVSLLYMLYLFLGFSLLLEVIFVYLFVFMIIVYRSSCK